MSQLDEVITVNGTTRFLSMGLPAGLVNAGIVALRFGEADEFQKALVPFP
jgi:hypothetical protein